ncbi:MAG: hypothetical protein L3J41_02000 [Melioribacteraceae bacterium]|nr:hypothetical protein [Melioribacteraceae bacterium]
MTTFTIKKGFKKNPKTEFETARELFIYLREKLSPIKLYQIDEDSLSEDSLEKIEKSRTNSDKKLTDFQG